MPADNARARRTTARRKDANAISEPARQAEEDYPSEAPAAPPAPGPAKRKVAVSTKDEMYKGVGAPNLRPLHQSEGYLVDHHGFTDLCHVIYRDIVETDTRLARNLTCAEFTLSMSWYLAKYELMLMQKTVGLTPDLQAAYRTLEDTLPNIALPLEIVRYLENLGQFETAVGVSLAPRIFDDAIPEFGANNVLSGSPPAAYRHCRISFGYLAMLADIDTGHRGVGAVAPPMLAMPPGRWHTAPGHDPIPGDRRRREVIVNRTYFTPSDEPAEGLFQISPLLLSDFISFMKTLEKVRLVSVVDWSNFIGTDAQLVISQPITFTVNSRELGSEFVVGQPLDLRNAQAGRLHRYQRFTPRPLTFGNAAAQTDSAINISSVWSHAQTCDLSRLQVLNAAMTAYVTNGRRIKF
jgi:hypothetical protein